jgi:hypothetical protein
MPEITTGRLTDVLMKSGLNEFPAYLKKYENELTNFSFSNYFQKILSGKGVSRSTAVSSSGIEIHYGYQILNGSKKPSRDKIICLCIAAGFNLKETQRALNFAELGPLYPKRMRDAAIILAINNGINNIWKVNDILSQYGLPLLA